LKKNQFLRKRKKSADDFYKVTNAWTCSFHHQNAKDGSGRLPSKFGLSDKADSANVRLSLEEQLRQLSEPERQKFFGSKKKGRRGRKGRRGGGLSGLLNLANTAAKVISGGGGDDYYQYQ